MKKILALAMFGLALLAAPTVEAGRVGGGRVGFRPVPVRPIHGRPSPVLTPAFRRGLLRISLASCNSFRFRRWSRRWAAWMFYHPIRGWFFYSPVIGVYLPVQYIVYVPPGEAADTPGDAMELPLPPDGKPSAQPFDVGRPRG